MNVTERFLKYVSFHTTSDEDSQTTPSSACQLELGKYLAQELADIGLEDAHMDEFGRVYAYLPASADCAELENIGFVAHMDTSPDASGENIKPRIIRYEGGDIVLSEGIVTSVKEFPFLDSLVGKELIITDGTTLLGADDKAGVAEIVTLCEYLAENPDVSHRGIAVCFTPDEEIGCGADHFNFEKFKAKKAYTVDGGELGEIEYENFNAASAHITVNGVNIHPGSAKNKMKNAVLMGADFISRMPAAETPAHTEGYEGFYHIADFNGCETQAKIAMIIRDHDREKFEARKAFVADLVAYLNRVYGEDTFELELKDSYFNMKEHIVPHMELIRNAEKAMRSVGAEPKVVPIRGGTDGATLSYEGLPCPNLSTGGMNFHSVRELIPVESLEKMVDVLKYLASPEAK